MLTQHARLLLQSQLEICWANVADNKRIVHKLDALLALVKMVEPSVHEVLETEVIWKAWEMRDHCVVPEKFICEVLLSKLTQLLFESFEWDNDSAWTLRSKTVFDEVTNRIIRTEFSFNNSRTNKQVYLGSTVIDNFHGILKESLRLLDALDNGVDPHDMVEKGI
jgi:hypothetical protein